MKKYVFWGVVIAFFVFLRCWKIEERINFSMDQGESLLKVRELWKNRELTLLGPPSSLTVFGRQFFFGPMVYYLLMGIMLLANWQPIRGAVILVLLNLGSMIFLYLGVKKLINKEVARLSCLLWVFCPASIDYSNNLWNPSLMLLIIPVAIYFFALTAKRGKFFDFGLLGLSLGVGLQLHFQVAILIGLTAFFVIIRKEGKGIFWYCLGLIIGYAPLLLFDIRNNFYNVETMWLWLNEGNKTRLTLSDHYFLSWWPIIIIGLGWLGKKYRYVGIITIIVLMVMAGKTLTRSQAKGMPDFWNYKDLKKTEEIISEQKNEKDFNIVNLLSGDTRFYPLRYLLTIKDIKPMPVNKYSEAEQLWVIADNNQKVTDNPVWEISSMGKSKISNVWQINEKVNLYKLMKDK
ncbi:MAG: glycosyltransferase family 39 protein [Candidatus Shapirobacteria bacterium]